MIRLLCPAARCYLTASYTSSPPTSVLLTPPCRPRSRPLFPTTYLIPLRWESLRGRTSLEYARRRPTVFLRLCSPQVWINCCVFDIHSLSGPGRRRWDERIKGKVTQRAISVCLPVLLFLFPLLPRYSNSRNIISLCVISCGNRYRCNIRWQHFFSWWLI